MRADTGRRKPLPPPVLGVRLLQEVASVLRDDLLACRRQFLLLGILTGDPEQAGLGLDLVVLGGFFEEDLFLGGNIIFLFMHTFS